MKLLIGGCNLSSKKKLTTDPAGYEEKKRNNWPTLVKISSLDLVIGF
jgi:hypothetical protein